ncbi:hypothetical protein Bbelb_285500 [Branchiostoma belcheri]|nr:hypothetical protein Bbelb_285500 [Branchiostoma belcheri]
MAGPCTSGCWRWVVLVLMVTTATVTGQGCPKEGYVQSNGVCYKVFDELKTQSHARYTCAMDGGLLAMPKDSATNSILHNLAGGVSRWIGLTNLHSEFQWVFEDGITLASYGYTSWGPGEPNHGNYACVEIGSTGYWNDVPCSGTLGFICQLLEVCPKAGYYRSGGVCYKAYPELKPYGEARQTCAADGGTLAMPKNERINIFIHNLSGGGRQYFGLTDEKNEGQWAFADGQTLASTGYSNWAAGEPNSNFASVDEDCAEAYGSGHLWNDAPCSRPRGFICQQVCPDGYNRYYRGSCYRYFGGKDNAKSYDDARQVCQQDGGDIFMWRNANAVAKLKTVLGDDASSLWIGLSDENVEGTWVWADGTVLGGNDFTDWLPGPSVNTPAKDCAVARKSAQYSWRAAKCSNPKAFICQTPTLAP